MTDSFQSWLVREIRDVLGRHNSGPPFIVWCDPDRSWLDLLREASSVDGFELWAPASVQEEFHELLVRDRFYSTPRAARVVWLPCSRDAISWFKPFELEAEDVWEKSLLNALREYGVEISRDHEDDLVGLLPAHAREWFDKPKETWKELTPGNAKGTLVDDHCMLQVLGGPAGEMERLREEGHFDIFARRATEDFGLPDPQDISEDAWRVAATARLLCTEAADAVPHEPPREGDKIIPAGLARTHSLKLLNQWQHDIRYIANFERLVPEAEATVGLTYWARNLTTMPRSRGSRAVEETLFKLTTGDEFDSHDGQLQLTGADDHLRRYVQAIRKLRDSGYSRVIVVTDHGFFHWQPGDHEVDDELPAGKVLWKHRLAMVGHNLSHPTAVRLDVPQSNLEVVVPRSTNAFRTYGALGFFHGGATLQELVIPVVVATWPAKAKKASVVLKPVGHITSEAPRVQVQAAATGQLFNADVNLLSRRVLVKIKDPTSGKVVFKHAEPVTIEPEGKAETIQLAIMTPKPELGYGTRLVVEVLDADDEQLLGREEVELKIDITDW